MTRQCKMCRSGDCESQLVGEVRIESMSSFILVLPQSTKHRCHAGKWDYTVGCLGLLLCDLSEEFFNGLKFSIMLKMSCKEAFNVPERERNK